METGLLAVMVFVAVIVGFVFAALFIGRFVRPRVVHSPAKDMPYECGEEPAVHAWFNYNPRFFLIALVFVIFDVEIALVLPVAVVLQEWTSQGRGLVALGEITLFVSILLAALVYVWMRGDLKWIKELARW